MTPDEHEDVLTFLVPDVGSLLAAMRADGLPDSWASFQVLVLWVAYALDVSVCLALRATPRTHEAPAEVVAHLRSRLREGLPYERHVLDLWALLTFRGVPHDEVPDLLLEAGARVLALRVERDAFEAVGR